MALPLYRGVALVLAALPLYRGVALVIGCASVYRGLCVVEKCQIFLQGIKSSEFFLMQDACYLLLLIHK
jgi:hypothetical protein